MSILQSSPAQQSAARAPDRKATQACAASNDAGPIVVSVATDWPGANRIEQLAPEAVRGRPVVLVGGLDDLGAAADRLQSLGAGRIFTINAHGADPEGQAAAALLTAQAIFPQPGRRAPSELLLRAGQACAAAWPLEAFGDVGAALQSRADAVGSSVEAVTSAFMAAVSGLCLGRYRFQARDRFTAATGLWFGDVEPPGYGKSQAGATIFDVVRALEMDRYRTAQRAKVAGVDPAPIPTRALVGDATLEAAQAVAAEQGRGLIVYHDELPAFFDQMTRYQANARPKWLSAYNGDPDGVDRKWAGYTIIPVWGASVWGGIQPSALASIRGLDVDDGLGARFIWLRPMPAPLSLRPTSTRSSCLIDEIIERAFVWREGSAGITDTISMTPRATARFEEIRYRILSRARADDRLDSWTSKLPGLLLRVAGNLALIDAAAAGDTPRQIDIDHVDRAVSLVDVFGAHRRRVVSELGTPSAERVAAEVAGWVVRHRVLMVSTFELRRGLVPGARSIPTLRAALGEMADAGWLDTPISPRASDPLPGVVRINPQVAAFFRARH